MVSGATQDESQLWVRSLEAMAARRLEGRDGAQLPFWSPDSRRIGFFTASGKLKTIAASGGHAEILADPPNPRGGAWSSSNTIVYAPDLYDPLYRVPAGGGKPEPVTKIDAARKESVTASLYSYPMTSTSSSRHFPGRTASSRSSRAHSKTIHGRGWER